MKHCYKTQPNKVILLLAQRQLHSSEYYVSGRSGHCYARTHHIAQRGGADAGDATRVKADGGQTSG